MKFNLNSIFILTKTARNKLLLVLLLCACLGIMSFSKESYPPLQTTNKIEIEQFLGDWYSISNIPYFGEKNKIASKTTYKQIEPNLFQDIYTYRNGSFNSPEKSIIGKTTSLNESNTKWKSTFYWIITFNFEVLHLSDDNNMLVLGHESRDYGWVLSRNNRLSDREYFNAMMIFEDNGYDISRFEKVPQFPEDIGKLGYQVVSN